MNKVWTLVDLPDDRQAIENKWIFKKKNNADGNINFYKAWLVAKGFQQVQGVDYDKTFSPVVMLKSVWNMLAIVAFYDYEIWQMDVKTAFLNGYLKEELYMMQPEGFVDPTGAKKCASSNDPFMDWCKPLRVGIYALIVWSKHMVLYRLLEKPVFTRKWVGAL